MAGEIRQSIKEELIGKTYEEANCKKFEIPYIYLKMLLHVLIGHFMPL